MKGKTLSFENKVSLDLVKKVVEESEGVDLLLKDRHDTNMISKRLFLYLCKYKANRESRKITQEQYANYLGYKTHVIIGHLFKDESYYLNNSEFRERYLFLLGKIMNEDNSSILRNKKKLEILELKKKLVNTLKELNQISCEKTKEKTF